MRKWFILSILSIAIEFISFLEVFAKNYTVNSPDNKINIVVNVGERIKWSVTINDRQIILPSEAGLMLNSTEVLGTNVNVKSVVIDSINNVFKAINYKKTEVLDHCKRIIINCKDDYGIEFRAYNDGIAYRFFTKRKGEIVVRNEVANFNFPGNQKAFIPIMWDYRGGQFFNSSFEALYREISISQFPKDSLAFLPVLVELDNNMKAVILEADMEDYPGMYLNKNENNTGFYGVFAPYPLEAKIGGFAEMNFIPTKRTDYIAKTKGTRTFPWRVIVISEQDKQLLDNDMIQKLASPSRINDVSWIKPGQSAWDWWNNWNISHVDFKAGINTETYKYYIDFAAANKLAYIILDEGWSDIHDLFKLSSLIDVKEIVNYAKQKNIGVVLWATWYAVSQQMDKAFPYYSSLGVKGFKIDFFDRDDQVVVASTYEIAKKAAENKLLVDYHGIYKPTGLQRTYPNVIGFEGVKGLENYKWANEDAPRYAVSIPFIRMMAGPMDYTPGAMRNSNQANFRAINDNPMSKGTRCNQMAMYVMYEAPFQMLADNPTIYMKEQECTDFISSVPTTFDETVALDGKVGEFAAIARRKGNTWYISAMTNWNERNIILDFSFLKNDKYKAVVFKDGINADREGTDYKKEIIDIKSSDKLNIHLAPGGGWVARIESE